VEREAPEIRVLLGLGNPGLRYRATRHNLGYRVIDLLCRRWGVRLKRKTAARIGYHHRGRNPIVLAKSLGYMNESGAAAGYIARSLGFRPADVLVLFDDAALPLGRIRVRRDGSDGGHRGLRSVLEELKTESVPRLRMGIAGETSPGDVVRFVLENFEPEEREAVERLIETSADCVEWILENGMSSAMNEFNRNDRDTEHRG
jgi:PTH1 family peptidyl-tRNA hydrolase